MIEAQPKPQEERRKGTFLLVVCTGTLAKLPDDWQMTLFLAQVATPAQKGQAPKLLKWGSLQKLKPPHVPGIPSNRRRPRLVCEVQGHRGAQCAIGGHDHLGVLRFLLCFGRALVEEALRVCACVCVCHFCTLQILPITTHQKRVRIPFWYGLVLQHDVSGRFPWNNKQNRG